MKKLLLLLTLLFFIGCSNKINVPIIQQPYEIKNNDIRYLKINIQNDSINLTNNIINELNNVNSLVPNYFIFNEHKTTLNAKVYKQILKTTYKKNVKLHIKGSICKYDFYLCKSINGTIFCNTNKKSMSLTPKEYNKIKDKLFKNKNYVLYNNKIYTINKKCKPTHKKIKCEKASLEINVDVTITDLNNTPIFSKNYTAYDIKDPCKNITYYQNQNEYKVTIDNNEIYKFSTKIAKEIVSDIAPHKITIYVELYDSIDIDMDDKDKKLFDTALSDKTQISKKIQILSKLNKKYPNSCIIPYDLSLYLTYEKKYNLAKNLLAKVINNNCDNDIKTSASKVLFNLQNSYSKE